jgi:hypothetical protein
MAKLTSWRRRRLPDSAFAIPEERKFPLEDESHARNALTRASGTKYEGRVKAAVARRYPGIEQDA